MLRIRFVVLATAGGLALAGCGQDPGARQTGAPDPPPVTTSPTSATEPGPTQSATPAVPQTLAFSGRTVDGKDFDAAALAGKPAVLWFWAPWCSRCRAAAPEVTRVAGQYAGKVTVIGIAGLSDDAASMRQFVTSTRTGSLTHLADGEGKVWKRFGVTAQDTYVLIGTDGTVAHSGPLPTADLSARIGRLAG